MSTVYFPVYSAAIFKVLNRHDLMGLQMQDVCLQSKLLTWYLKYHFCCCFTVFLFSTEIEKEQVVKTEMCESKRQLNVEGNI